MPNQRAVNALSQRVESAREAVRAALYRAGYDARTLDQLPEPGDCTCPLAAAIHEWKAANAALDDAWAQPHGQRY